MNSRRIALASIIAPPFGILAVSAVMGVFVGREEGASWSQILAHINDGLFFLMFFGAPIGYVAEAIVGVPAYHWLVRTGRVRVYWVVAAGTLGGALAFGFAWMVAWNFSRLSNIAQSLLIGAFGGAVAGVVFWLTAFLGGLPPDTTASGPRGRVANPQDA